MTLQLADVDDLMMEYAPIAEQVDQLTRDLAAATTERNAVLAAFGEAGLTQQQIVDLTGLTITQLRTALHNDWLRRRVAA